MDIDNILTQLNTFVRKQQADTITATHTFDPTQPGPAFQLGPNAQNQLIQYLNADKVDGFNASQTPAPNTIPVALSTGKLDIGWLPDDIGDGYGYRRIDLTNATTDYNLQLNEEAYYVWNTSTNSSLPLRIQVSGKLYQLFISIPQYTIGSCIIQLYPNNQTYVGAFSTRMLIASGTGVSFSAYNSNYIYCGDGTGISVIWLQTTTECKSAYCLSQYLFGSNHQFHFLSLKWINTTTVWSSLGTLTVESNLGTIYVLVRRIL
jgi:hypothetical protein